MDVEHCRKLKVAPEGDKHEHTDSPTRSFLTCAPLNPLPHLPLNTCLCAHASIFEDLQHLAHRVGLDCHRVECAACMQGVREGKHVGRH